MIREASGRRMALVAEWTGDPVVVVDPGIEMHLQAVRAREAPLTFTAVIVVIVLVLGSLAVCRPCLVTYRALPGEMVQGFHVLEPRSFGAEVAGAFVAFEVRRLVARRTKVVITSFPSC